MPKARKKTVSQIRSQVRRIARSAFGERGAESWDNGIIPRADENLKKRVSQATAIGQDYINNIYTHRGMYDMPSTFSATKQSLNVKNGVARQNGLGLSPWNNGNIPSSRFERSGKTDTDYRNESEARHNAPADWKQKATDSIKG